MQPLTLGEKQNLGLRFLSLLWKTCILIGQTMVPALELESQGLTSHDGKRVFLRGTWVGIVTRREGWDLGGS